MCEASFLGLVALEFLFLFPNWSFPHGDGYFFFFFFYIYVFYVVCHKKEITTGIKHRLASQAKLLSSSL